VAAASAASIKALVAAHTQKGFDDILILGDAGDETVAAAGDSMCAEGIMNYMVSSPALQVVNVDAGKVHYDRIALIGHTGTDPSVPYGVNIDSGLKGDSVLMFGAGGPMGQMHVQLVIEDKNPPKVLIATDIDKSRLDTLRDKFSARAKERGIAYHVLNPNDFTGSKVLRPAGPGAQGPGLQSSGSPGAQGPDASAFRKEILRLNGGRLFDYVVCLAAIPAVIEDSSTYLADGAILNIFAGVSRGTIARLNVKDVAVKSVRYIGSSGSSLDDMVFTLRKVERGELETDGAVAGVSGIDDVWSGIEAVRTGTFPGKIVVYPHVRNLPLTALKDLKGKLPGAASRLTSGGDWNREAEKALLDETLNLK
jgi:threonine dehydrogenase-like Zn-dependent dehydrogenase